MEALRYNPNNKMTRLFKNIRLDFCMSMHYIISGPLIYVLSPMKKTTVRLFKNLRLEIFTSPCVISQVVLGYISLMRQRGSFRTWDSRFSVHKFWQKGHSGQLSYRVIFQPINQLWPGFAILHLFYGLGLIGAETWNIVNIGAAPLILFGNLVLSFLGNCNCTSSNPHLKGRFFNGITLPEVRSMSVETDWFGAIKQYPRRVFGS